VTADPPGKIRPELGTQCMLRGIVQVHPVEGDQFFDR
jgi:hypothetical protein